MASGDTNVTICNQALNLLGADIIVNKIIDLDLL